MTDRSDQGEGYHLDESAWIYLSIRDGQGRVDSKLHRSITEVCESSGWPAVSWSTQPRREDGTWGVERFLDGMSHAVEHADVVVVLVNDSSEMTEKELEYAFEHRRPVIGLRFEGSGEPVESEARIRRYERSRLLACGNAADCVVELRRALADPDFAATIREAAGEATRHV